ncbi:Hypothetical protein FKW44_001267 [Caligus rogercresseyi]|uniref:Uncharacterized protein n=1 Tax=Caligus rogercresseyi TaxID=217165 RepID=A0A7T8KII1_CALRO|nr:Hypothetical protein FKW44_001267 [Caligus rogercresseyi]
MNFPPHQKGIVPHQKILQEYAICRKKQNFDSLDELFDVTKVKGQWLCKEYKNLYELQCRAKARSVILLANVPCPDHPPIQAKEYIGCGCVPFSN